MNKSIMMGRLVRDPEIRYTENRNGDLAIAKFRLAVDRKFAKADDEVQADFFSCTAFGRLAEFVEKYLFQGIKIVVQGRMQNDNYTNRDGSKVYGVCLIVDDIDFAESKRAYEESQRENAGSGRSGRSNAASSNSGRERTSRNTRSQNSQNVGRRTQPANARGASGNAGYGGYGQNPDSEFMDMNEYDPDLPFN